jgi:hypothetical protein
MTQPWQDRVIWMDTTTPLSPGARFVWERAMEIRGTMGGTTRPAVRGRSCPPVATSAEGGYLVSQGGGLTHNAGVAGSSPAPAIAQHGAQAVAAHPVTRLARLFAFARRTTCGTMGGTMRVVQRVVPSLLHALCSSGLRVWT